MNCPVACGGVAIRIKKSVPDFADFVIHTDGNQEVRPIQNLPGQLPARKALVRLLCKD